MLNRCNDYDCTVCQRFSCILFTIPGVLTVRECNELEINHSAKESQCVHAEYSVSNCVIQLAENCILSVLMTLPSNSR
jgi:hypothetical protein